MSDHLGAVEQPVATPKSAIVLPAPRLQLRWEENTGKRSFKPLPPDVLEKMQAKWGFPAPPPTREWFCHYELVLPLSEYDIRREVYTKRGRRVLPDISEVVVALKQPTVRESQGVPCTSRAAGERYADEPFRDGVHARRDAALLGSFPVYIIAPDGATWRQDGQLRDEPSSSILEAKED